MPVVIILFAFASAFVGLLQFSGVAIGNPFVNDDIGQVSGTFANRNHFALVIAMGLLTVPVWAFRDGARSRRRAPLALALILLFVLITIASGSRAGLFVGLIGLTAGLVIIRREIRAIFAQAPRWAFPAAIGGVVATVAIIVLLSVAANRAVSIDRLLNADAGQDMRRRALPSVLDMIATYFPAGSGLGGFDPIFRISEPFALLKTTYFNHAHNDFLEVALDAGLLGIALLVATVFWWSWNSARSWRPSGSTQARLGSAMLFLVGVASLFDYPARTPIVMAFMALGGLWLGTDHRRAAGQLY
jgi:O-antigen ligase